MNFLLARDQAVDISEAMLIAMIRHGYTPVNTFNSLHSVGCDFKFSEAVFSAAISHHRCILAQAEHLLTLYPGIRITEAVLVAATSNHWHGRNLAKWLLRRDSNLTVTEDMIINAVRAGWVREDSHRWLFERFAVTENSERLRVATAQFRRHILSQGVLPLNLPPSITGAVALVLATGNCKASDTIRDLLAGSFDLFIT